MKQQFLLLIFSIAFFGSIHAMQSELDLKALLGEIPSLKLLAARQAAQHQIPEGKAPEEVLDFVEKIKNLETTNDYSSDESRFFIKLLNDSDITDKDIETNFPELIKLYLPNKIFINKNQLLNNMLLEACKNGKLSFAKLLILLGADINTQNEYGDTSLIMAAHFDHKEIVELLLDYEADTQIANEHFNTALLIAAEGENKEIALLLLEKNADRNAKNKEGFTALIVAANFGYSEIVKLLINKGAEINAKTNFGDTALIWAVKKGYLKIARILLNNKAKVDIQFNNGITALMLAVDNAYRELIELLLNYGANIFIKDNLGNSPISLAKARGLHFYIKGIYLDYQIPFIN